MRDGKPHHQQKLDHHTPANGNVGNPEEFSDVGRWKSAGNGEKSEIFIKTQFADKLLKSRITCITNKCKPSSNKSKNISKIFKLQLKSHFKV